jgi:hypothetical protein
MPRGNQTAPHNPTARARGKLFLQCSLILITTNHLYVANFLKVLFSVHAIALAAAAAAVARATSAANDQDVDDVPIMAIVRNSPAQQQQQRQQPKRARARAAANDKDEDNVPIMEVIWNSPAQQQQQWLQSSTATNAPKVHPQLVLLPVKNRIDPLYCVKWYLQVAHCIFTGARSLVRVQ